MRQPQGQAEAVVSDSCRKRGLLTMARSLVVLAVDGAVCVCVCVCVSALSLSRLLDEVSPLQLMLKTSGFLGIFCARRKRPELCAGEDGNKREK